jgi:hypothetical protein
MQSNMTTYNTTDDTQCTTRLRTNRRTAALSRAAVCCTALCAADFGRKSSSVGLRNIAVVTVTD